MCIRDSILRPPTSFIYFWAEAIEHIDVNPLVTGAAQPKLTAEALMNLKIVFPPSSEEQAQIQKFIIEKKKTFNALSQKASTQVELLFERRTALISAAVTGKIDVRGWKPPSSAAKSETEMEVA